MRGKRIVGDVISHWQSRCADRPTIAFCVDKPHAQSLADEFTLAGVRAAVVVDETEDDERAEIFAAFEARKLDVLTSVGVLGIGFDSPIASCAILARPTLSTMLHIQQCGRVLRPYEGKGDALILDHAGNTLRHGLPIDFTPPSKLSEIDKRTDRKARDTERPDTVICRRCTVVYPRQEDACPECGTPRERKTKVLVLDGQLRPVSWESDKPEPTGMTPEEVRRCYQEMLSICEDRCWKRGSAWFMTGRAVRSAEIVRRPSHVPVAAEALVL